MLFAKRMLLVTVSGMLVFSVLSIYSIVKQNSANKHTQNRAYQNRKNNPWNNRVVDSTNLLLKTGDLIVRRGDDMTSYMLSRMNVEDKTYSHCGIVVVEDGKPYVYHSIGGEDNPDEVLRKDSAAFWCSPANNLAYAVYRYSYPDTIINSIVKCVDSFYSQQIKFDMDFDLGTDDRLYCSEMIYKGQKIVLGDSLNILPHQRLGRTYVGIDDLYLNGKTKLVCQIRFK